MDINEVLETSLATSNNANHSEKQQKAGADSTPSLNDSECVEKGFLIHLLIYKFEFVPELTNKNSTDFDVLYQYIKKDLMHILLKAHGWKKVYSIENMSFSKHRSSSSPVIIIDLKSSIFKNQNDLKEKIRELITDSSDLFNVVEKEEVMETPSEAALCLGKLTATVEATLVTPSIPNKELQRLYRTIIDVYETGLKKLENLSAEEYLKNLRELNELHKETMKVFEQLKKEGITMSKIEEGSLHVTFEFERKESLGRLWDLYLSGQLLNILQTGLISKYVLEECKVESVQLNVYISEEDYMYAKEAIGTKPSISEASCCSDSNDTEDEDSHQHEEKGTQPSILEASGCNENNVTEEEDSQKHKEKEKPQNINESCEETELKACGVNLPAASDLLPSYLQRALR